MINFEDRPIRDNQQSFYSVKRETITCYPVHTVHQTVIRDTTEIGIYGINSPEDGRSVKKGYSDILYGRI